MDVEMDQITQEESKQCQIDENKFHFIKHSFLIFFFQFFEKSMKILN